MKRNKINKKLNYQPASLQAHESKSPFEVMDSFFLDFPIHETRDNLWELYKGWVYHSSAYTDEKMTKDMLCFFTQFSEFLNACFIFTQMKAK